MASRANNRIVVFSSADKTLKESWSDKNRAKNLANFPSPFRMLCLGPPNMGKSTVAKNIVIAQDPPFDEVYVVHQDAGITRDYIDLEPTEMFSEVPSLEFWNTLPEYHEQTDEEEELGSDPRPIKRLVIIDDLEYTSAHKQRLANLAILFRYASSHKGLSIILCHQSFFDVPALVKKMSDVFIVWRSRARNELSLIENRVGLPAGGLSEMFNALAKDPRDSIAIDCIRSSPAPLRLNLYTPIRDTGA